MKALLVVFGVMLIFAWVVGDALMQYYAGSRRASAEAAQDHNAIAVQWLGGSLTNAQLNDLVIQRRILNSFIEGVVYLGQRAAIEAGVEPRRLRVEPIIGPATPREGVERSVVQTRLFAEAAREAGMRISDESIVQYLDELGRGNVTRDEMRSMLTRLQSGTWRVSIDFLIAALREEMLARNYIASHQFSFDTVTPHQRWADWLRVNDRVVIEAAAIPSERFLVDVPEPSEAELVTYFDEFKNLEKEPDFIGQMELPSARPGFRIPRKIDVQYIQANYDQYVSKAEGEITDEEIEKYYEENKDPLFIKADTELIEESTESEDTTDLPPTDQPAESTTPSATDESSSDDAVEEVTEEESAEEDVDAVEAPSDADQSSRSPASGGPFRLTAFLQQDEPTDTTEPAADATESAADATDTDAAEGTDAPASEAEPSDDTTVPAEPDEPTDPEMPDTTPAAEEKLKEFQPLDEVRDVIRRDLAERRAAEKLNDLVNEIASQLTAEFNPYLDQLFTAQAEDRELPAPPAALADLAPLAKEHGLEHGRTGPLSLLELRDSPVGKSGSIETGITLWQNLFLTDDLELYEPITTADIIGNRYVALKTSDTPFRVPEFAEVKEQVKQAWKREKAAEFALKHAEAEAKKAEEAGTTLGEFFSADKGIEVVRTDPFSQYTGGDVAFVGGQFQQQPLRLSEPDGVVAAGPEFLLKVFELKQGKVGAVLNHDQSIAYVIRIVEHMSSPEELHTAYLAEANTWPGLRLMVQGHARESAMSLVSDIALNVGLDWLRPADRIRPEDEG
jgi:hypothetical protein